MTALDQQAELRRMLRASSVLLSTGFKPERGTGSSLETGTSLSHRLLTSSLQGVAWGVGEFGAGRPNFGGRRPRGEALGQENSRVGDPGRGSSIRGS